MLAFSGDGRGGPRAAGGAGPPALSAAGAGEGAQRGAGERKESGLPHHTSPPPLPGESKKTEGKEKKGKREGTEGREEKKGLLYLKPLNGVLVYRENWQARSTLLQRANYFASTYSILAVSGKLLAFILLCGSSGLFDGTASSMWDAG